MLFRSSEHTLLEKDVLEGFLGVKLIPSIYKKGDKALGGVSSGLGLAIINRIVGLHKGQVSLKNHPAGGLNATVTIPII